MNSAQSTTSITRSHVEYPNDTKVLTHNKSDMHFDIDFDLYAETKSDLIMNLNMKYRKFVISHKFR